MSGKSDRGERLFPYLLILGIFAISVAILDLGWSVMDGQRTRQGMQQRDDEARQILGTMAYGARPDPYLTRVSAHLATRLRGLLNVKTPLVQDAHRKLIRDRFPEHELWAFSFATGTAPAAAQTILSPRTSAVSTRGMARAFAAIDSNDRTPGNDKLVDFLFGPGMTTKSLALRKGKPTRIIYRQRHHLLIWNTVSVGNKKVGGFFLLVQDTPALQRYAMTRSSRLATAGRFHSQAGGDKKCFAGYLPALATEAGSIFPPGMKDIPVLEKFMRDGRCLPGQAELERRPLPWAEEFDGWELYIRVVPKSPHLAFVFLPRDSGESRVPAFVVLGNLLFVTSTLLLLLAALGKVPLPAIRLKTRFALLFVALAAIPFSLFFIVGQLYLGETRTILLRDARQGLHKALSSFDQGVEEVYLVFRNELQKLHEKEWLKQGVHRPEALRTALLDDVRRFLKTLSPALPWGAMLFVNPEGKMVQAYRTPYHQNALAGYMRFNRVGLIDAMRKMNSMAEMEASNASSSISTADVSVQKAFVTLLRLPISHGFLSKSVGQPTQVAFGSFSIVRVFDYFPSVQEPRIGFAVAWLEEELDRHFCLEAQKRLMREYSGSRFAFFRNGPDGLRMIARSRRYANLKKTAFAASLRNDFSFFLSPRSRNLSVAFPSKRRPGIILAGEMDTGFIDEKMETFNRLFLLLCFVGLITISFFQRLLSTRLILPLLQLRKAFSDLRQGGFPQLPSLRRRDEIWKIFEAFNEMMGGLKARQRLLSLVSGQALEMVRDSSKTTIAGEEEIRPLLCMVSDIRDFTTLCERHPPEVMTCLLNQHFDRMSRIIHAHGGEINRFIGDAIEASFPCPLHSREETFQRVTGAGLSMLQSIALINEERERQGFFAYRIGIGVAFGTSRRIHVGSSSGRTEVLEIGEVLKRAGRLEELSKEFPACPLVIDEAIGGALGRNTDYARVLQPQVRDSESFFIFTEPVEARLPELVQIRREEASENPHGKKDIEGPRSVELQSDIAGWLPGIALILLPFLLGLFGIHHEWDRSWNEALKQAHGRNQRVLDLEKLPLARKGLVEIQLQKTIADLSERCGPASGGHFAKSIPEWTVRLEQDLRSFGLTPEAVVVAPFRKQNAAPSGSGAESWPNGPRKELLDRLLQECLGCYGQQFDRFLSPSAEALRFLGDAMNGVLLSRDSRARFEAVSIASQPMWLYWQPVLDLSLIHERRSGTAAALTLPEELKSYGRFPAGEASSLVQGGVLILTRPPGSIDQLRLKPEKAEPLFVRIDLKRLTIEEERGEPDRLLEGTGRAGGARRAEDLLAIAYRGNADLSGWAVDTALIPGAFPKVHVVATPVSADSDDQTTFALSVGIFILLLMLLSIGLWNQALQESGITRTVSGQILGSFFGTILLPIACIGILLNLLVGDWKVNLVKEGEARFLHQVDRMEQKVGLSNSSNPGEVRKILEQERIAHVLDSRIPEETASTGTTVVDREMAAFMDRVYQRILRQRQDLGVHSVMVDNSRGRSEFLAIDGTLSPKDDPMKRAFSFHADRVLKRLHPSRSSDTGEKPESRLLVDEMTAHLFFEILDSTFGPDASIRVLFGQGTGADLFSSVSNDVFFQDFFPDLENPSGSVFTLFSELHSNLFAMARILAAWHFQQGPRDPLEFEIHAASRLSPGMPLIPETGEALPFIREIAERSILTGPFEDRFTPLSGDRASSAGHVAPGDKNPPTTAEEVVFSAYPSLALPQFVFVGTCKWTHVLAEIQGRIIRFAAALILFLTLLFVLSLHTSRDVTVPLLKLLDGMARVKQGDYRFELGFGRFDELEEIAVEFNRMVHQLAEKDLLARMVSESAVEMAHSEQGESDAVRGRRREAAVVYVSFSRFGEVLKSTSSADCGHRLDRWVKAVCANVSANGGEVDKIMEGKILAVFFADRSTVFSGASERLKSHVERAFMAAVQICENAGREEIPTICGVHAGNVISGLMGNRERRDFTIIGDPVNMAARCASLAEHLFGADAVVAAEETAVRAGERFTVSDLGTRQIKGKQAPTKVFRVSLA